jgi:Tfp pilus assembly protein PilO
MNILDIREWSERQQVAIVILMAGLAMFLLWFFLLTPLNNRRRELENDINGMQSQLARKNYLLGEDVLRLRKAAEHKHNRDMHEEWLAMARRLAAFTNQQELAFAQVGKIDFKVKLYNVRQRLLRKSRALDIDLPYDLGMEEAVHSNEDARKLMLQLMTVEKLVDLALDLKINELKGIEPLLPIAHQAPHKTATFLEEFPIRLTFFGNLENLYDFFRAILQPRNVFVMRHLRVEAQSPGTPDVLTINTVISSLLFVKAPDEVFEPPKVKIERRGPAGH